VHAETLVGWDELAHPNETVDDDGNPVAGDPGFAVPDPRAPGRRAYDSPGVQELRERLRAHNGIHGLDRRPGLWVEPLLIVV
jgi:hypothetical protein